MLLAYYRELHQSANINSAGDVYVADPDTRRIEQFSFLSATMKNAPGDMIRFSPRTGGYAFTHGELTVSGLGEVRVAGGVVTVTDSQPDRRIRITYQPNQLFGKAVVSAMVAQGIWQTFVLRS
ncbi:MAG TPA: hypothetical protein VJX67_03260 [Blastocatellia bacterium]|nr:hypothetical protein [Blastocatellia bacterium]